MKKIQITLSTKDINQAIKEVKDYNAWIEKKTNELTERLALIGAKEATVRFGRAYYDGSKDASVEVTPIKNGWQIVAFGNSVFFIEFGAGVYFNGQEPYPEPRPQGVAGIGEYGEGKGKSNTWGYYENDELILTHGTPAAMPMYYAKKIMEQEIKTIAKEVFG